MDDKDRWKRSEPKAEPEVKKDCGCGFGKGCIANQKHHWAPAEFDAAYPNGAPPRYTRAQIRWMRDNPGEPPPDLGKPTYPDHWADK